MPRFHGHRTPSEPSFYSSGEYGKSLILSRYNQAGTYQALPRTYQSLTWINVTIHLTFAIQPEDALLVGDCPKVLICLKFGDKQQTLTLSLAGVCKGPAFAGKLSVSARC